jgi:hypothetical protein
MDVKKINESLNALRSSLHEDDNPEAKKMKQLVMNKLGPAVKTIFNLEIELNKMHKGHGRAFDNNLGEIRKNLRSALDLIGTHRLFDLIDRMYSE